MAISHEKVMASLPHERRESIKAKALELLHKEMSEAAPKTTPRKRPAAA